MQFIKLKAHILLVITGLLFSCAPAHAVINDSKLLTIALEADIYSPVPAAAIEDITDGSSNLLVHSINTEKTASFREFATASDSIDSFAIADNEGPPLGTEKTREHKETPSHQRNYRQHEVGWLFG